MKILTNIQSKHLQGITQTVTSLVSTAQNEGYHDIEVVGVDLQLAQTKEKIGFIQKTENNIKYITAYCEFKNINDFIDDISNVSELEIYYSNVISTYEEIIKKEKPDIVLLNGTYFKPWCLYIASKKYSVHKVLHYHGILTKETEHLDEKPRKLLHSMETYFDSEDLYYIFPSLLAKNTVESEVFGHSISSSAILPNPVPIYFFNSIKKVNNKRVGVVCRWERVKNPSFIKRFAKYNFKKGSDLTIKIISDIKDSDPDMKVLKGLVEFVPPMQNTYLKDFYSSMDVILSPSTFETYGNVPLESIASGTPALVSSNMGVSEVFKELGLDEWIIDFRSSKEVLDKSHSLSGKVVSNEVRRKIRADYSPSKIHKKMFKILNSI